MECCSKQIFAQIFTEDEKGNSLIDTNIISLNLKEEKEINIENFSPIECVKCKSIFSCHSNAYEVDEYKSLASQNSPINPKEFIPFNSLLANNKIWICEFCGNHNILNAKNDFFPKKNDVFYIKKLEKEKQEKMELDFKASAHDQSIIFCIDNSGSMSGTNLNCVKRAVTAQLKDIHEKYPKKKVGLVTFESQVQIYGDGMKKPINLPSKSFDDFNACIDFGKKNSTKLFDNPISKTLPSIIKSVDDIRDAGSTALGPGLLASIGLLLEGKPSGSLIVLCTDGEANQGLGTMNDKECDKFYNQVGKFAKEKGIVINVLTIKGGQCRVDKLALVTEATGGMVSRIKPTHIMKDFNKALEKEMVGTNAKFKLQLHRAICFKNEDTQFLFKTEIPEMQNCIFKKELGNITASTELSFEFKFKSKKELAKLQLKAEDLKELPFQAQIEYTNMEENEVLRVITMKLPVTQNKEEVKKGANVKIVAMRVAHDVAKEADLGNTLFAKRKLNKWRHFIEDELKPANINDEEFNKFYDIAKTKNDNFGKSLNKKIGRKLKKKEVSILKDLKEMNANSEEEIRKSVAAISSSGSSDECEANIKNFKLKRVASFLNYSDNESMSDEDKKKPKLKIRNNSGLINNNINLNNSDLSDDANSIKLNRIDSGLIRKHSFVSDGSDEETKNNNNPKNKISLPDSDEERKKKTKKQSPPKEKKKSFLDSIKNFFSKEK